MSKFLKIALLFIVFQAEAQIQSSKVLIPYRDKNLWGMSDTLGNVKIKPIYKEIKNFIIDYETNFTSRYVVKSNKTYYVIDQNKKILLPEINPYDSIYLNKNHPNHFWVFKKGKVGLYHKNKEIISCLYDKITVSENNSYEVQIGKLSGLINSLGKLIIPIEYVRIRPSWDDEDEKNPKFVWVARGMLAEKKFYDTRIINKSNSYGADKIYGDVSVNEASSYDYKDVKKKLESKYDVVGEINKYSKYAYVTLNQKKGVVNLTNLEEMVAPNHDEIKYFSVDKDKYVFLVKSNQKYGLVKEGNHVLLENEFDKIEYDNKTRLYLLEKDNKKGCIVFNTIYPYIQPKYLSIKSLDGIQITNKWQFGLFEVTTEKGRGIIGENGIEFFKD